MIHHITAEISHIKMRRTKQILQETNDIYRRDIVRYHPKTTAFSEGQILSHAMGSVYCLLRP